MSLKEVEFEGSPPWGFRMNGGADAGHPLRISRVNPGSKAELKGVREGDLITSINGQQTKCLTNSESHALLRTVKENLRLGLNEDSSPKRRSKEKSSTEQSEPSKESTKPSSSKARRRRRSKLKSRFKELLGFKETSGKVINLHPFAEKESPDGAKEPEEASAQEESDKETVVLVHECPNIESQDDSKQNERIEHAQPIVPEPVSTIDIPTIDVPTNDSLKRPVQFDGPSRNEDSNPQTDEIESAALQSVIKSIDAIESVSIPSEHKDPEIEIEFVENATEVLICSPEEFPEIKTVEDDHIYETVKLNVQVCPPYYSRRYLEVISEETSDLSESDKAEKTRFGSQDGIDTSWRDGKSLEEVSDVPVLSDSQSDTDVPKKTQRPSVSVVKSVISSYCSKEPLVVDKVNSETHKVAEKEVELVYIDSSDSELFSSVLSSQSSDSIDTIITDVQETAKAMMSDEFLSGSEASLAKVLSLKELSMDAVLNLPDGLLLLEEIDSERSMFPDLPEIYDGWVALATEDPRLLVCLSPTQMKNSKSKDANQLLDLHEKFIHRRGYHESDDEFLALQKYHELRQKKMKSSHEVGNSRLLDLFQTLDLQSSNVDSISRKMKDDQRPNSAPLSGEAFRERMYEEYMSKLYDLAERRNSKVLKLSSTNNSVPNVESLQIQSEFMSKVQERMAKLGIPYEREQKEETSQPKHLKELMELTKECSVWSPLSTPEAERKKFDFSAARPESSPPEKEEKDDQTPPVWTPKSAGPSPTFERKFRSVNFQSPPPKRKGLEQPKEEPELPKDLPIEPNSRLISSTSENSSLNSAQLRLPSAQNPTITLLQKAREGHIPKGAQYLEDTTKTDSKYSVKNEYYTEEDGNTKHVIELTPKKFEGIGPTTRDGIPIGLRSEVKEDNQQKWYKRMYDSLHKADHDKDFVTVRYKTKRKGQYPYSGGYVSEPERLNYDSDASISKYATLDRRKIKNKENDFTASTLPRNRYGAGVRHAVNIYKNQPGRIEDYEPGRSSISESEAKQWWDEVLDIFDGELNQQSRNHYYSTPERSPRSFTYALKDTGYDSDSTLVFRRRENNMSQQLSPADQKEAYKVIQRGGEVPLSGLRKPAPERPKEPFGNPIPTPPRENIPRLRNQESPHRYVESEVNIHYRSPIRSEAKGVWPEDELAEKQAEIMRRIYQEQRRTKYLNELHDMYSRRHTDNFIPSQKSPIPLNRYDDFPVDLQPPRPRDRTPEPKLVARALFNFVGQTSRELTFRRGDIIYVRRQIDKNWYEGEHNAMIGLFPFNYVEIIPYDGIRTLPKKASEGQARAKFNFQAQSHLELSLVKGELVLLTRRVDENWFEGRIGTRKGIFPVSYVEVLVEPGERAMSPSVPISTKPIVAPASHSVMLNGAKDLGQQHYQPPRPALYSSSSLPPQSKYGDISMVNQTLHIDTQNDPVPYRVLYNYRPQNEDELELKEGDVVYVMEKCDDGWYVGSLHRNGQFGTFPGNYVERIQ